MSFLKTFTYTSTFLLILHSSSTTAQIQELKKASDKAQNQQSQAKTQKVQGINYVNPFIGTGGHGHTYPGATAPFGMMQLSPDTRHDGWDGCSGYHYSDSIIYGFSHTHLSGTGVSDLADLLIVPQQGNIKTGPAYRSKKGYGHLFSHKTEKASPGLYQVKLKEADIDVRLTTTERCGIHEYSFNQTAGKKYILIDLNHRDEVLSADIKATSNQSISGHRHSKAWAKNQRFFFKIDFNIPFEKNKILATGKGYVMYVEFPENTKKVLVKVGISAVDQQGAEMNLASEMPHWNFDSYVSQIKSAWAKELNKIEFYSPEKEVMVNFYTALYHTYLAPTLFSDVDGRFLAMDGSIQKAAHKQYSVFSLWDTYRAAHPLYTLIQRKRTEDFLATFLSIYKHSGDLPMWELLGNETDCMIGYHSVSVITDAYRKGIRNADYKELMKAMIATSNLDELGKRKYEEQGFLSTEVEPESVSKTLEYAYDDWCIALLAKELGDEATYNRYLKRSYNFLNVYNPESKFMQARRGGTWFGPFNPSEVNFNYTEANAWQYSLAAPQHMGVLRKTLGGNKGLEDFLDALFSAKSELDGRHQVDITGLIGQYAHGNEPSHHMAYLYNFTHSPHKTQERIDQILRTMYSNQPDGLSGNEDCGQMSAWYVLSAMGIYPVAPGSTRYAFGRPLQDEAKINLEDGQSFTLRTQNNSPENKYIQKITLNGKPYTKLYIDHKEFMRNGVLEFEMGPNPNVELKSYSQEPFSEKIEAEDFVPVPYFTNASRVFEQKMETEIKVVNLDEYNIHFTTDGTEPTENSPIYSGKLSFSETTLLKARTIKKGLEKSFFSQVVSMLYSKKKQDFSFMLKSEFANQYAASGKEALVDGLKGGNDFRSGDWQGFEGVSVAGDFIFNTPKAIQKVHFSFLQDERSWIFLPESITVEYSLDGNTFKKCELLKNTISPLKLGTFTHVFSINIPESKKIVALRFSAQNRGTCPKGHISEGGKAWLFADEIWFE